MSIDQTVTANCRAVRQRIGAACARVGRDPADVTLVAVTKYAQLEWVRALVRAGETQLGESRPQQLAARAGELRGEVQWHLIGPLQRNKVRLALPVASLIHSVDSVRLLDSIDRIAGELDLAPRVLLEVNLTGDEAKHGFDRAELVTAREQLLSFRQVRIEGLMTMAAYSDDPESARTTFAALRELRDELHSRAPQFFLLPHLSMGMSGDFEVAIEEGATLIRVGSALWEGLE
jgi:hypothetical protein